MSIERLRGIEENAVNIFNDSEKYKRYLNYVSETSSYRWYNSMIFFSSQKKAGRINTESGWKREGYSVKPGSTGLDILVPKYKTEFISNDSGDVIDVKTLSSDELGMALTKQYISKRSYTYDLRDTRVYTQFETDYENTSVDKIDETDIQNILDMLLYKMGVTNNGIGDFSKCISKAIQHIINDMKKTKDIAALNIRAYERTIITASVQYVVLKYLDYEYNGINFGFLYDWLKGLNNKESNNIIKIRCLDKVSLIAGSLIGDINEVIGVSNGDNEEIIDKNYNLNDLFKAAEADSINTKIHRDKIK